MTRWALGAAVLVGLAAPLSAQNKPEAVVARAIAAHGGLDALKKYPGGTTRFTGKVFDTVPVPGTKREEVRELPFTGSLAFQIPGKARVEMTFEALGQRATTTQVVNGQNVRQTENGSVSKLDDATKAELRESAVIQEISLLYPLLDPAKYTLEAEPDATVDGRECATVTAKARGLKDSVLYFDKKTGQLAAMQRKALNPARKQVTELTTFSNYKTVRGMIVPMRTRVSHDGKPFLEINVSEYMPLEKVDEKLFVTE